MKFGRSMKKLFFLALLSFFSLRAFAEDSIPIQEGYIESDGSKIYYKRMGKGDPIIVIHGGPGQNHTFFLPQFEVLAKNHELIFYDQRGSGNSAEDFDPEKINLYQFVDDLNALRKTLDIKNFTLLGYSWGAAIVYQYAYENPDLLSKVILLNPLPASSQDFLSFALEVRSRLKKSGRVIY